MQIHRSCSTSCCSYHTVEAATDGRSEYRLGKSRVAGLRTAIGDRLRQRSIVDDRSNADADADATQADEALIGRNGALTTVPFASMRRLGMERVSAARGQGGTKM